MKEFLKIDIAIYRAQLKVFFGSIDECVELMLKDGRTKQQADEWKEEAANYLGMYFQDDDYRVLWLPRRPYTIDDYGILVHELEHTVFNILRSKGLRHTPESDEAYSYLIGYLYSEIELYISNEIELENQDNKNHGRKEKEKKWQ